MLISLSSTQFRGCSRGRSWSPERGHPEPAGLGAAPGVVDQNSQLFVGGVAEQLEELGNRFGAGSSC